VAEVVREAFRRAGLELDISFKPWARVVHDARTGVTGR
jgi:hypothetical protein